MSAESISWINGRRNGPWIRQFLWQFLLFLGDHIFYSMRCSLIVSRRPYCESVWERGRPIRYPRSDNREHGCPGEIHNCTPAHTRTTGQDSPASLSISVDRDLKPFGPQVAGRANICKVEHDTGGSCKYRKHKECCACSCCCYLNIYPFYEAWAVADDGYRACLIPLKHLFG